MNKSGIRTVLVQDSCLFALTALLVTGCVSTPRQSYTGDPLPDSQIARLSVEPKKQSFWQTMNSRPFAKAFITHVDQKALGSFWGAKGDSFIVVDLLPGDHSIAVALRGGSTGQGALFDGLQAASERKDGYLASGYGKILQMKALAGHKYTLKYVEKRLPLVCWIEDSATGEVVSDAKPPANKE